MSEENLKWPIGLGIILILAAVAWHYRERLIPPPEPEIEAVNPTAVIEDEIVDSGPMHPVPEYQPDPSDERVLQPLPPLDDSDAFFLLEIGYAFGPALESLLVRDAVIDRLVATIDTLPRRQIPSRIRPVKQLTTPFHPEADNVGLTLGPQSYARYDTLARMVAAANLDDAYDTYRRFYPLFQRAYERLGYPDAYFNDRLVEVIDHLLAAPLPEGPIVLTRPNVLYEFADPDLEGLSSGQKLMLRMGPDNVATIRPVLEQFRDRLTATTP